MTKEALGRLNTFHYVFWETGLHKLISCTSIDKLFYGKLFANMQKAYKKTEQMITSSQQSL